MDDKKKRDIAKQILFSRAAMAQAAVENNEDQRRFHKGVVIGIIAAAEILVDETFATEAAEMAKQMEDAAMKKMAKITPIFDNTPGTVG